VIREFSTEVHTTKRLALPTNFILVDGGTSLPTISGVEQTARPASACVDNRIYFNALWLRMWWVG
jgi:hypothetical protein